MEESIARMWGQSRRGRADSTESVADCTRLRDSTCMAPGGGGGGGGGNEVCEGGIGGPQYRP